MFKRSLTCIIAIAVLVMSPLVFADTQESKAVFDVRVGSPETASLVLGWIHMTYEATPDPDFAVIFMGPAVTHLSTNREGVTPEDQKFLDEIATKVSEMKQDGIQIEICNVAADLLGVDPESVLPDVTMLMSGGWASLIQYEKKGYALVPAY
jgi:intracellular sulfur oxidation DsrE/DsrF family protein